MKKLLYLFLTALIFSSHAAVRIASQGKPEAEIIITTPHPTVEYAANELQGWLKEISGAKLPILNTPRQADNKIILAVNPGQFSKDLEKLNGNDGYAVRQQGNTVYIFGSCPKGVLNGVYKWLYKNTDIIWARPNTEFGTIFTACPNLEFIHNDYLDIPAFILRGWQMIGPGTHLPSNEWQYRNGSNWSVPTSYSEERAKYGQIFEYGGGHNLNRIYITEKKYYNKHPEFFPLRNGKRLRPGEQSHQAQLCFTNPDLLKAFIAELDARVKKNPDYATYRIMIEDNWLVCECQECLKPIEIDKKNIDNQDKAFRSTQFFLWLNKIAAHMRRQYPGKRILTFGYFFTEYPPYCTIDPIISVSFCPIYKDSRYALDTPGNKEWHHNFLGWMKIKANLTWREYYGLVGPFPRPTDKVAFEDWRYVLKHGVNRTYSEMYADAKGNRMNGLQAWDMNSIYFWCMAQGAWNPHQDVEKLRREFLERAYGPAAEDVNEFYRITETGWSKYPAPSYWDDLAASCWRVTVVRQGTEEACRNALKRAAAKVKHPNAARMLQAMCDTFEDQIKKAEVIKLTAAVTTVPPSFDSDFQTGSWSNTELTESFYLSNGNAPKEKTSVRLLYDVDNLYIGVKCHDQNPGTLNFKPEGQPRDKWPDGEKFELFLTGPQQDSYQIVFDPNRNLFDASNRDASWNGNYKLQTQITSNGWSAMVSIPFSELGYKGKPQTTMSIMFLRYNSHKGKKTEVGFWHGSRPHNITGFGEIVFKN